MVGGREMKYKHCSRLMAVVMLVVMLCTNLQAEEIIRGNIPFNQMKYEEIELSEVEGLLKEGEQIAASNNLEKQEEWKDKYFDLYYKTIDNLGLLNLYYSIDYTNSSLYDEYQNCIELIGLMESQYIALFGGDESGSVAETQSYFDLMAQRQELVNSYNNLYQDVTILVNNQPMNLETLSQQSTLSFEEKQTLEDKWYDCYNAAAAKIFLQLAQIDQETAQLEGYSTAIEYMYAQYGRQYLPQDAEEFSKYVKEYIPPIYKEIEQRVLDNLDILKDYGYASEEEMMQAIDHHFICQDMRLQEAYEYLITYDLYDMKPSSKKIPGAWSTYINAYKEPFILINDDRWFETMISFIHEFGHFNFSYHTDDYPVSLDLAEAYAETMELFALPYYEKIIDSKEVAELLQEVVLADILRGMIDGCIYNEFCKTVYNNPQLTTEELNNLYERIAQDYGLVVDSRYWVDVPHNFQMPFYYLSYTSSAVVSFDLWGEFLKDEEKGKELYWKLIEAATEEDVYKATQKVGLHDPFKEETIKQIVTIVSDYLGIE